MPTVFVSDHDVSNDAPPVPGLGRIECHRVDALTSARTLRALAQLTRYALELWPG